MIIADNNKIKWMFDHQLKFFRLSLLVFVLTWLFPCSLFAKPKTYGDATVTRVISVYDGDSFRADVEGHHEICGKNMPVRIYGIDTPEIRGQKNPQLKALAQKAKAFAVKRLKEGKSIILKSIRRGKYFRIVAEVWIDGINLGKELIKAGLAKPYFGRKKRLWEAKHPAPESQSKHLSSKLIG